MDNFQEEDQIYDEIKEICKRTMELMKHLDDKFVENHMHVEYFEYMDRGEATFLISFLITEFMQKNYKHSWAFIQSMQIGWRNSKTLTNSPKNKAVAVWYAINYLKHANFVLNEEIPCLQVDQLGEPMEHGFSDSC